MAKKIIIGIIYGGRSAEHEVSLRSVEQIVAAVDVSRFEVRMIKIEKDGRSELLQILARPDHDGIDVFFPVLHGPFGEDGTIQGVLRFAGACFVGADVLGSAVGMDKDVMKRLLREAGIPTARSVVLREGELADFGVITAQLGLPIFVKPANLGSSVGIHKVKNEAEFSVALTDAFAYDRKVIIEEAIVGREIECAVLGNDDPIASTPGEVTFTHDFYDYEAKYLDASASQIQIPADITDEQQAQIRALALKVFRVLECAGLGRVDFFLKNDGEILVNEINTIPGFTSSSMYPMMWQASGVGYSELISRLIDLALEK